MKDIRKCLLFSMFIAYSFMGFSQVTPAEEEEDYSQYDKFSSDESVKRYCTPKVVGLSPAKLITLGYEMALGHKIEAQNVGAFAPAQTGNVNNYSGLFLGANLPVLSNNKILINVGGNFVNSNYSFSDSLLNNPLLQTVDQGIRTFGLNTTIFKPLNQKNFILAFLSGEYNGNNTFSSWHSPGLIKATFVGVYGWKFNDRFQFGVGATQTYRAGGKSYLPVIMYNYTSKNEKWGIEALLPARFHHRYSFNRKTMLLTGFEIVGASYHLANRNNYFPPTGTTVGDVTDYRDDNLELRRSEIRLRLDFQKALTDFIWISAQAGYIVNYKYNVDSGNFYRGFGSDRPMVMENNVTSAPYFQVTLNLVSP
jgi:hypothetical protein